jgi:hypothetical protein
MRFLLILIVLINVALYGLGQGWLGAVPSNEGRGQSAPPERAPENMVPLARNQ